MKRLVFLSLVVLLTTVIAVPVSAGGSWLEPNDVRVEAGDHLVLEGGVSIGQLGWVEDGPYFAYLAGEDYGKTIVGGFGGSQTDILLGPVGISDATRFGAYVSVEFTLPENVPPGRYLVVVCNDPCTTGFGDLIGSNLFVGMEPVFEEAAALSPDGMRTEPTASRSPDPITTDEPVSAQPIVNLEDTFPGESEVDPVLVGGGALLTLLLIGGLFRLVKRPRHERVEPEKISINR
jgi:hypothetical protein